MCYLLLTIWHKNIVLVANDVISESIMSIMIGWWVHYWQLEKHTSYWMKDTLLSFKTCVSVTCLLFLWRKAWLRASVVVVSEFKLSGWSPVFNIQRTARFFKLMRFTLMRWIDPRYMNILFPVYIDFKNQQFGYEY